MSYNDVSVDDESMHGNYGLKITQRKMVTSECLTQCAMLNDPAVADE